MSAPDETRSADRVISQVLLFAPTLGFWQGTYHLPKKVDVAIEGVAIDRSNVTSPQAKLLGDKSPVDRAGKPWKKRFAELQSRKTRLINELSLPFPINGVRMVPKRKGNDFLHALFGDTVGSLRKKIDRCRAHGENAEANSLQRKLERLIAVHPGISDAEPLFDEVRPEQSLAYDLHRTANEFADQLDDIVRQLQENPVYELVKHKLPRTPGQMRAKFKLDCVPVEIAGGTDVHAVTAVELLDHQDVVRETVRQHTEAAVATMIANTRNELAEALTNMDDVISRNGAMSQKTFNVVRRAIERIRDFDFVSTPELIQQVDRLSRVIETTRPAGLDAVTAANNGFTAMIREIRDEVASEQAASEAMSRFGVDYRNLDLD